MPRKVRNFHVGGVYHLINRGVDKQIIFKKKQDYSRFILALEFFNDTDSIDLWNIIDNYSPNTFRNRLQQRREQSKQRLVDILAFALMPNHYHLVAQEIVPNGISLFMKKLGGYSTYFNKQYNRSGTLFQSRFKSVPIEDDNQLYTIFTYVHSNPVGLIEPGWKEFKVENPTQAIKYLEEYKWSSYPDYIGKPNFPNVSERKFFLDFYGSEKACQHAVEDWVKHKAEIADIDPKLFE